ncbi:hypothetical protein [Rubritalea tangerina]|uniref:hypothetical protein n=1 Tax=Rubritalea tangerina TaxID=430798 RepID=UPI00360D29F7
MALGDTPTAICSEEPKALLVPYSRARSAGEPPVNQRMVKRAECALILCAEGLSRMART